MSSQAVSDSGPIIHLAKIGKLDLLKKIFDKIFIPEEVYKEAVIEGIKKGYPDAYAIKEVIEEGWIEVRKPRNVEALEGFHKGECEAISLARELKAIMLSDDKRAREYGRILGLEVHGSFWVIIKAFKDGIISYEDAEKSIIKLASTMFVSVEILAYVLGVLRETKG